MASDGGDDPQLRYRSVILNALSGRPSGRGDIRSLGTKVLAFRTLTPTSVREGQLLLSFLVL